MTDGRDLDKARQIDQDLDQDKALQVAFNKFVQELAGTTDDTDVQVVEATYRALNELEAQGVIGNQNIETEIQNVRTIAENALSLAEPDDDTNSNKQAAARRITRDELIRRYVSGSSWHADAVTISDVQTRAEPEHELEWTTVDRAFGNLAENWEAFYRGQEDGQKALLVNGNMVSEQLARTVSVSLEREDIANIVVGGKEGEA